MTYRTDTEGLWLFEPGRRELDVVDGILAADEQLLLGVAGHVVHQAIPAVRRWIILVTDRRLLCIKPVGGAPTVVDVPRSSIQRVQASRMLVGWQLVVETGQGRIRIQLPRPSAIAASQLLMADSRVTDSSAPRLPRSNATAVPRGRAHATESSRVEQLEEAVDRLELDVSRMQQQIDFLEAMLRDRHAAGAAASEP